MSLFSIRIRSSFLCTKTFLKLSDTSYRLPSFTGLQNLTCFVRNIRHKWHKSLQRCINNIIICAVKKLRRSLRHTMMKAPNVGPLFQHRQCDRICDPSTCAGTNTYWDRARDASTRAGTDVTFLADVQGQTSPS